jgi:cell division transport system permease protein
LSLALLFLLFDLFWIAAGTSQQFYRNFISQLRVEAYVEETVADTVLADIARQIRDVPEILQATTVTRDSARARLSEMIGTDLLVGYDDANPLPRSFVLVIEESALTAENLLRIEQELMNIDGLDAVHYSREWLLKAEEAKRLMWQIGLALGILIVAAAVISSANNIRLMTQTRAVGFKQMLLLGAGKTFIALPFVVEGLLISGLAAAAGWGIILYGRTRIALSQVDIVYPNGDEIILYCAAVAVLGAVSGFVGLRKRLRG